MQHSEGNYPASRLPLGCFSQWQLFLTRCIGSVSNPSQKCSYSNIYETGSHTRKTFLAFRYAKELTGSNPWSYKPEQILFDCRKKLPVRCFKRGGKKCLNQASNYWIYPTSKLKWYFGNLPHIRSSRKFAHERKDQNITVSCFFVSIKSLPKSSIFTFQFEFRTKRPINQWKRKK